MDKFRNWKHFTMTFEEATTLFKDQLFTKLQIEDGSGTMLSEFSNGTTKDYLWEKLEKYWDRIPNGNYRIYLKRSVQGEPDVINVTKGSATNQTYQIVNKAGLEDLQPYIEQERKRLINDNERYLQGELDRRLAKKQLEEVEEKEEKIKSASGIAFIFIEQIALKFVDKYLNGKATPQQTQQPTNQPQGSNLESLFDGIFTTNELENLAILFHSYPGLKEEVFQNISEIVQQKMQNDEKAHPSEKTEKA